MTLGGNHNMGGIELLGSFLVNIGSSYLMSSPTLSMFLCIPSEQYACLTLIGKVLKAAAVDHSYITATMNQGGNGLLDNML